MFPGSPTLREDGSGLAQSPPRNHRDRRDRDRGSLCRGSRGEVRVPRAAAEFAHADRMRRARLGRISRDARARMAAGHVPQGCPDGWTPCLSAARHSGDLRRCHHDRSQPFRREPSTRIAGMARRLLERQYSRALHLAIGLAKGRAPVAKGGRAHPPNSHRRREPAGNRGRSAIARSFASRDGGRRIPG